MRGGALPDAETAWLRTLGRALTRFAGNVTFRRMRERVGMPRLRLINPRNPLNHLVENDVARRLKEVLLCAEM